MPVDIVNVAANNILRMSFRFVMSLSPETAIPAPQNPADSATAVFGKRQATVQYKSDSMAAKLTSVENSCST